MERSTIDRLTTAKADKKHRRFQYKILLKKEAVISNEQNSSTISRVQRLS